MRKRGNVMNEEKDRRRAARKDIVEWMEALLFAFALIVLLYTFLFRIVTVSGTSMEKTLQWNDRVIVSCLAYQPQHGDIIVVDSYTDYGEPLVKRVIAVGGDVVDINERTGTVSVNGGILDEPYVHDDMTLLHDVAFPLTVPEGYVFLLGDNRGVSLDSRSSEVGLIDERDILGKVILRIFPFDKIGVLE